MDKLSNIIPYFKMDVFATAGIKVNPFLVKEPIAIRIPRPYGIDMRAQAAWCLVECSLNTEQEGVVWGHHTRHCLQTGCNGVVEGGIESTLEDRVL